MLRLWGLLESTTCVMLLVNTTDDKLPQVLWKLFFGGVMQQLFGKVPMLGLFFQL